MTEPVDEESYELKMASSAARAIREKLPEAIAWAALELIDGPLLENPHRVGAPLEGELAGRHGARVGPEYRVVYRIDDVNRIVEVIRIARRADIYGIG